MILDGNAACADIDGCQGGGKCSLFATCYDVPAPNLGFTCGPCAKGTTGDGKSCVINEAACGNTPTGPHGGLCGWNADHCKDITLDKTFVNANISQMYTCTCKAGYREIGGTCVRVLSRSGACKVPCTGRGSECVSLTAGTDTCTCATGFMAGASTDATTCVTVDGCARAPCFPGVQCTTQAGVSGFVCKGANGGTCPAGFKAVGTAVDKCTDMDDCAGNACGEANKGHACTDTGTLTYSCTVRPLYSDRIVAVARMTAAMDEVFGCS